MIVTPRVFFSFSGFIGDGNSAIGRTFKENTNMEDFFKIELILSLSTVSNSVNLVVRYS